MSVFTDALINESCCPRIFMCAIKIDAPWEINQQRWKWRRRDTFPTWSISFPLFLFISPKSERVSHTKGEGLYFKRLTRCTCVCIRVFLCKRPGSCLAQWALQLKIPFHSQYGDHMAVRIWRCVPLSLSGMSKGLLLLLFHTLPPLNVWAIEIMWDKWPVQPHLVSWKALSLLMIPGLDWS